jgi:hypothetical protein
MDSEILAYSSSNRSEDALVKDQFIFTLGEFEGSSFDASTFVAKYRRVATLDSLRAQLRQYADAIKSQLFVIINRDYRDFITIATKLDGVDTRVDILRRPLLDLRLDLHALHDGLLGSLRAIDSKLRIRSGLHEGKVAVETALRCVELLDAAEEAINAGNMPSPVAIDSASSNNRSRRREMVILLSSAPAAVQAVSGVRADTVRASELERASCSLRRTQSLLASLRQAASRIGQDAAATSTDPAFSLSVVCAELGRRERSISESLSKTIRAWLDELLTTASSNGGRQISSRVIVHCLRALEAIGKSDVAQAAVQAAVLPLARAQLSQGRVGGATGRGSFSGLSESLQGLLVQIKPLVEPIAMAAESMVSLGDENATKTTARESNIGLDLLICGVWAPVIRTIMERFPEIVTLAIPGTLHASYSAIAAFTAALPVAVLGDKCKPQTVARVHAHPLVQELEARWGLDLYFTMRLNEVVRRVDYACDDSSYPYVTEKAVNTLKTPGAASQGIPDKSVKGPGDAKDSVAARVHQGLANSTCLNMYSTAGRLTGTLSPTEIAALRRDWGIDDANLHLPLTLAVAVEMSTCLHDSVVLPSLTSKFLGLALRLLLRLEVYVVASVAISTARNPSGASSCANLIDSAGGCIQVAEGHPHPTAALDQSVSPAKGHIISQPSTPQPQISSQISTIGRSSGTAGPSMDELALLVSDLSALEKWLLGRFMHRASSVLASPSNAAAVSSLLASRACGLAQLRNSVLLKIQTNIAAECKALLSAGGANVAGPIRAIASRYRMTNKPAPDTPSPYVETVLRPLKTFLKKHSAMLDLVLTAGDGASTQYLQWVRVILEASSQTFALQVQSLMETVRTMDSSLQSRRKMLQLGEGSGAGSMTDSEKISLQVQLDVNAYAADVYAVMAGLDPAWRAKSAIEFVALDQLLAEAPPPTSTA